MSSTEALLTVPGVKLVDSETGNHTLENSRMTEWHQFL